MFFCKQKTAYEMRISDWSSDVCSSDLSCSWFNLSFNERLRTHSTHGDSSVRRQYFGRFSRRLSELRRDSLWWHLGIGHLARRGSRAVKIGSASCRERVCQYV